MLKQIKKKILQLGLIQLYRLAGDDFCRRAVRLYLSARSVPLDKILLHITEKCNYRCSYCYVDKSAPALTREDWLDIIEQSKKCGVKRIGLLGGEPFLSDDLGIYLEKIKQLRMDPYIYTNGSQLSQDMAVFLKRYDPLLVIKYDSDNNSYASRTNQTRYSLSQIEENILSGRKKGLRIITFNSLFKDNVIGAREIADRSLALGVFPAFERFIPATSSFETNNVLAVSNELYDHAIDEVETTLKSFLDGKRWPFVALRGRACACYNNTLSISITGEVLPCPYLPVELSLGHIKEKSLKDIVADFMAKKEKDYQPAEKCRLCQHFEECAGGCRTYSYLQNGIYNGPCHRERFVAHAAFTLTELYGDLI